MLQIGLLRLQLDVALRCCAAEVCKRTYKRDMVASIPLQEEHIPTGLMCRLSDCLQTRQIRFNMQEARARLASAETRMILATSIALTNHSNLSCITSQV
jgi:hypothetical protein